MTKLYDKEIKSCIEEFLEVLSKIWKSQTAQEVPSHTYTILRWELHCNPVRNDKKVAKFEAKNIGVVHFYITCELLYVSPI